MEHIPPFTSSGLYFADKAYNRYRDAGRAWEAQKEAERRATIKGHEVFRRVQEDPYMDRMDAFQLGFNAGRMAQVTNDHQKKRSPTYPTGCRKLTTDTRKLVQGRDHIDQMVDLMGATLSSVDRRITRGETSSYQQSSRHSSFETGRTDRDVPLGSRRQNTLPSSSRRNLQPEYYEEKPPLRLTWER